MSEFIPEGTSSEITGYLIPNSLILSTDSLTAFLSLPLSPVPTNASTITVSLESFKFFKSGDFITLTFADLSSS